jgi:LysM repeat protein
MVIGPHPVPPPYKPPLARRAQAVQSARGPFERFKWWWLMPILGLLPVVAAAVVANEGRFGTLGAGSPVASQPVTVTVSGGAPVAGGPQPTGAQAQATATRPAEAAQPGTNQLGAAAPAAANAPAGAANAPAGNVAPANPIAQPAPAQTAAPRATVQAGVSGGATATQTGETTTGPFRAYRVQPGDTVRFVAEMFGVSTASVVQASGLRDPDRLRVGQLLTIPAQPGWLYRVQPGESLGQIAARTSVSSEMIIAASNLATDTVRAGDVILIPDPAAARNK